jgi:hypothetical protein
MVLIRNVQLDALRGAASARLQQRLVAHVERYFAHGCAALGKEGTEAAIASALTRGAALGVGREDVLCRYVNLVFVFGHDFDQVLPWARAVVEHHRAQGGEQVIERLTAAAEARLRSATGIAPRPAGELYGA